MILYKIIRGIEVVEIVSVEDGYGIEDYVWDKYLSKGVSDVRFERLVL